MRFFETWAFPALLRALWRYRWAARRCLCNSTRVRRPRAGLERAGVVWQRTFT